MKVYIVIEKDDAGGFYCVAAYSTYEKAKDHAEDIAEYMDLVNQDEWTWTTEFEDTCVMIQGMTVVD